MADPTLFAAPAAAAHGAAAGGTVEITVTLLIIVGFLAGLAWFARRLRGGFKAGGTRIEVLGAQALGPKERAVLVRVGDTDILVGVAANSVNTLHVFPAGALAHASPADAAAAGATAPNFKALLLKSLGLKGQG
jgi:flagellar protein FliO/FliZ